MMNYEYFTTIGVQDDSNSKGYRNFADMLTHPKRNSILRYLAYVTHLVARPSRLIHVVLLAKARGLIIEKKISFATLKNDLSNIVNNHHVM